MTSQKPLKGPHGIQGYSCSLPVPFSNGSPVDYSRMGLKELKRFVAFMYKSIYRTDLPTSTKACLNGTPPKWWPGNVSHDKFLVRKGIIPPGNQKGNEVQHRLNLVALVKACYQAHGLTSLLSIGKQMASKQSQFSLRKVSDDTTWRIVDYNERTLILVDDDTLTYDSTSDRQLRERSLTDKKKSAFEVVELDIEDNHNEDSRSGASVRSHRTRCSSTESHSKQVSQVKPKPVKKGRANWGRGKKGSKRKLFEIEEDVVEEAPVRCKYCAKEFRYAEFCTEEHEKQCPEGPKVELTKEDFMGVFGMISRSQLDASNQPSTVQVVAPPKSVVVPSGRPIRRVPKRAKVLAAVRNNPLIPLTSKRGQKLVKEFESFADKTFPPIYERDCRPRSGYKKEPEKDYPNVMKKAIGKDSENPHMFTLGKRQRETRFQELVVGTNQNNWDLLNKCKPVRLSVKKIKPVYHTVSLPANATKISYLERQFAGAINLPKIRLVDLQKNPIPEFLNYLSRMEKEAEREREASVSDSSYSSDDSSDLFVLVSGPPNPKKMKK